MIAPLSWRRERRTGHPHARMHAQADRAGLSERAHLAERIDIEPRVACRTEAAARRELGSVARLLIRTRAYRRLGFVRLGDYARERLGLSARTLHAAAWVATRLGALPAVSTAFDRSDVSWTQACAICAVATVDDEGRWLALASRVSVADLERVARKSRPATPAAADPEADEATEGTIDGEPTVRVRLACPARGSSASSPIIGCIVCSGTPRSRCTSASGSASRTAKPGRS